MSFEHLLAAPESELLARATTFDDACLETIGAMANSKGGVLLLSSVDEAALQDGLQKISTSTQPAIMPEWETFDADAGHVTALRIHEAPIKPVAVHGRCYQRMGASNYVLSAAEIARLHFESLGKSWDALPHEAAAFDELDNEKVRAFIKQTNEKRRRQLDAYAPITDILERQSLLANGKLTLAALLLFGKHPQRFVPHGRIKAGRFKSETLIVDDQEIAGTLFEQVNAAFAFIQKHLSVRLIITGQPQRDEVWDYPLEAIREALINAVCHRDYSVAVETQIRVYDDHIVIWNPGSLPPNLQLDDLKRRHQSVLRNKLIGTIFYEAGLIEKWGSGTNRIMEECRKYGLADPEWREQQGLMFIMRKDAFTEVYLLDLGLNERQIKAVQHVKKRRRITNQEYQELTEVKKRTASDELRDLEERNIFERVGSTGKGTYYKMRQGVRDKEPTKIMSQSANE